MANANIVPPDAEKLVFAVDIMRFFLNKHHSHLQFRLLKAFITNDVNRYRPQVRQIFNANFEKVLKDIDDKQLLLVRSDYLEIQNKNGINGSSLKDYISSLKNGNVEEDILAGNFLTYCARIASMSSLFYANGCIEALDIGVDFIKSAFPDDPEKCKLISESMENVAVKYGSETTADKSPYLTRREPEPESSGTEDSSSSSAFTSETDSDESLTSLILRLNASIGVKGCIARNRSKNGTMTSCAAGASSESSESSIQNPTVSSSSSSILSDSLKCDVDMSSKIERYFKGVEGEPTLPNTLEPPRKSILGKRPSPRKENTSDSGSEDSETEVKKPKFGLPKTDDEKE